MTLDDALLKAEMYLRGDNPPCYSEQVAVTLAAELRKRQWVSVKDALPDNYRDVLVLNGCGVGIAWRSGKGWSGGYLPDKDPPPTLDEAIAQKQITHWMPLPNPPKGDKEGV